MKSRDSRIYQPIDEEERDLISTTENDEWIEVGDIDEQKQRAREYAEATIRKDKRMNIRISERDLRNLKKRALEEGIPYQTMVSMILHKYLSGRYAERSPQES
jgi:predicted DNA binding CopG/RHH family protein